MRVRIPLIIEESLIKQIDEIAGEKHRRAATIETALREYIARQGRKAKAAGAEPEQKGPPSRKTPPVKPGSRSAAPAAPAAKSMARAKR